MISIKVTSNLHIQKSSLKNLTRMYAFECKKPKIQNPRKTSSHPRTFSTAQKTVDVTTLHSLPNEQTLLQWKVNLQKLVIANGFHYYDTPIGMFSLNEIDEASQILKMIKISSQVSRELQWFNAIKIVPKGIRDTPSIAAINSFKSLIFYSPHQKSLKDFDVEPEILSALCADRLLYGDHLMFIAEYINKAQDEALCVYLNYVMDIEARVERLMRRQAPPKRLVLMLNVGQQRNYTTKSNETFLGCDFKQGNHFTMAVVNFQDCQVLYGDSLGWSAPTELLPKVKVFGEKFYNIKAPFTLQYFHEPVSGYHKCVQQCHQGYPLQSDRNICGVVVVVMSVIVTSRHL